MKVVNTIAKVLVALAAVAGAVYVIATYGEKIVAWAKSLLNGCKCCGECACASEDACACTEDAPIEEAPVEDVPAAEEAPAEEAPVVEDGAVVADEADFEG